MAYEEDLTAERSKTLFSRSHSRQATEEKERADQPADISHEHGNDVLALAKLSAALEFMVCRCKQCHYCL